MRHNIYLNFNPGYESYDAVLEAVRSGEVYAGVLNSDVAGYLQDTMNDDESKMRISIIKVLPIDIPVFMSEVDTAPFVKQCLHNNHKKAVIHSKFNTHRLLMVSRVELIFLAI